jgi:predicted CopG family antitoxin
MYIHVHGDERMATKTISIDVEAYERLRSVRHDKESFSQTIKRVVRPPLDYEAFRERLEGLSLSEKAAAAIEEQVRNRRRPSNRG